MNLIWLINRWINYLFGLICFQEIFGNRNDWLWKWNSLIIVSDQIMNKWRFKLNQTKLQIFGICRTKNTERKRNQGQSFKQRYHECVTITEYIYIYIYILLQYNYYLINIKKNVGVLFCVTLTRNKDKCTNGSSLGTPARNQMSKHLKIWRQFNAQEKCV